MPFSRPLTEIDFKVRALVVDKNLITLDFLKQDHDAFYNFFLKKLLERDNGLLEHAHVKIDGKGDRKYKQDLCKYLTSQLPKGKIKKLKFAKSSNDNLIQLVDMITGAIARPYRRKNDKDVGRWRNSMASKIDDIWDFR